ncbi:MAG: NAD(P)-dependent oxidoreductase [Acidimicrobiales bacterium]|jgi:3-hydroxyisobutyrate dehydrogenase
MPDKVSTDPSRPRVGFVGLGSQGGPMARRIVEAGFATTLWARRPESLEPLATQTATAGSLVELGRVSDLVAVCVVNDDDVRSVLLGPDGILAGMGEGGLVAIHSTVHPETCRQVADSARPLGISVIDAPVSGGGRAAAAGNLLVLVGGDVADLQRARPVLSTYGNPVVHLGPLGSGQVAKLINNALMTAQLGLADDALRVGAALELDAGALAEALAHGSGASFSLGVRSQMPLSQFPAGDLLRKDVDILASVAGSGGTDLGALRAAAEAALGRVLPRGG